tara:strand:- start:648 stop:1073 length:426 start_codon:yes stop_codon:yes gene_type:complete
MIKYSLNCKKCLTEFDSWFSSSKEFERLKKFKYLNCEACGSFQIEKSLMSPNLSNTRKKLIDKKILKLKNVKKKLKDYQKFVKKNFEFVGDNFAYEARSIHYNKNNSKKGIYGNASSEDIKELKDEGIETQVIPWIEDKDN